MQDLSSIYRPNPVNMSLGPMQLMHVYLEMRLPPGDVSYSRSYTSYIPGIHQGFFCPEIFRSSSWNRSLVRGVCGIFVDLLPFFSVPPPLKKARFFSYMLPGMVFYLCYDTALNEAESPAITRVQVLGSYLYYLGGVS